MARWLVPLQALTRRYWSVARGERGGASSYVATGVLIVGTLSALGVITGAFDAVANRIDSLVDVFVSTTP